MVFYLRINLLMSRHVIMTWDLYLPSIPASLRALGRVECEAADAAAPPDSRTSPLILTLLSQCFLDAHQSHSHKEI